MDKYLPGEIEEKWQKIWEEAKIFSPDLDLAKKPFYNLMMFPYPSAEGLHVGNMYAFTGSDIFGRYKRMQGYDVFEPIGLDGFGIHSENYALKVGRHPKEQAKISQENFYRQLRATGNAYDWSRKLETYDSAYYKWTQWIFIQLFCAGLAYRGRAAVNWCPSDKTVLADEQVIDGKCERDGSVVEKRELEQWFFKITKYADRLLKGLDEIDWSERVKIAQRQWIGRSEGVLISFELKTQNSKLKTKVEVFTTRPDTLCGATFMVLAPEHPLVKKLLNREFSLARRGLVRLRDVGEYVERVGKKTEQERIVQAREKTGVDTGLKAINPVNGGEVPVWIADYVLMSYGTGAIMAVPAHDQRDFEFAKKYELPIRTVILSEAKDLDSSSLTQNDKIEEAYAGSGKIVNSGKWNGWRVPEEIGKVSDWLEEKGLGKRQVQYHLRDWLISRQRYWGPPIPMINCAKCGWQPVSEKDLPVLLPDVADWRPKGTGKSPLASVASFVATKCPSCKGGARRETDVSDTFLDSAWYFLRYLSTDVKDSPFHSGRVKKWLPVNMYIGGAEHSVLHLLYTRFLSMVFKDLGLVDFSTKGGLADEPFAKFRAHGLLISGGAKMSKSKGNIVNPDGYIAKYGADTLRCYLMFCGRFTQGGDFQDAGIEGMYRFLRRVWNLVIGSLGNWVVGSEPKNLKTQKPNNLSGDSLHLMHKTIKRVTKDIESLSYNTAISALMIWLNALEKRNRVKETKGSKEPKEPKVLKTSGPSGSSEASVTLLELETFLKLLAPFVPHMGEELWQQLKGTKVTKEPKEPNVSKTPGSSGSSVTFGSIHEAPWPKYDPKLAQAKQITFVVQVNGKVRERLPVEAGISQKDAEQLALNSSRVQKYLGKKKPRKIVFVPGRLINFVI